MGPWEGAPEMETGEDWRPFTAQGTPGWQLAAWRSELGPLATKVTRTLAEGFEKPLALLACVFGLTSGKIQSEGKMKLFKKSHKNSEFVNLRGCPGRRREPAHGDEQGRRAARQTSPLILEAGILTDRNACKPVLGARPGEGALNVRFWKETVT